MTVQPGDVLAVRSDGWAAFMIRFGAGLAGKPNLSNHIAVADHYKSKVLWCIEGRPGGSGWRAASDYTSSRWTLVNNQQPKTDAQRLIVCNTMQAMIGTSYDWEAIAADAADDLRFDWTPSWHGTVPGHVDCSTLACYAYDKAGLARPPGNARTDQPADWDTFVLTRAWEK